MCVCMYTEKTQNMNIYLHRSKHKLYKAVKIKDIQWSDINRVINSGKRSNVSTNWVSRPAVTSLDLPVA